MLQKFDFNDTRPIGRGSRTVKKFPRRFVHKYPEGVTRESMRRAYRPFSYDIECWEGRREGYYFSQKSVIERWLKGKTGMNLNHVYSDFIKKCNWKYKHSLFLTTIEFDSPRGTHFPSNCIPILNVESGRRPRFSILLLPLQK